MPPDIVAFAIAFVIGVFAGVQIEKANTRERRAKWQRKKQRGEVPQLQPKHDAVPIGQNGLSG